MGTNLPLLRSQAVLTRTISFFSCVLEQNLSKNSFFSLLKEFFRPGMQNTFQEFQRAYFDVVMSNKSTDLPVKQMF